MPISSLRCLPSVLLISVVCTFVMTGCVTTKSHPRAFEAKKVALVNYSAPVSLLGGQGVVGLVQSLQNEWGKQIGDEVYRKVVDRLGTAMSVKVLSPKKVTGNKAYKKVHSQMTPDTSIYYAPHKIRPLQLTSDHERLVFAHLASELKVDAVILLEISFSLQKGSSYKPEYGEVTMRIDMYASDGTLLYQQVAFGKAIPKHTAGSVGKSLFLGAMDKDIVKDTFLRASLDAVDTISKEWSKAQSGR
ncbi:MAG: hypothetical protein GY822_20530 [Deltaproteobacteria bacterium]|nr:hypothetical protein [Deltaproteobacteria bacterium]